MKHRDRVMTALSHEMPDRCPMQIGFTPEFAQRLQQDLRLADRATHDYHGGNACELERQLDQDLLLTAVGWAKGYYGQPDAYTDPWGVDWRRVKYSTRFGAGHYTEVASHPLANNQAIDSYRAPDPGRPELYVEAEQLLRDFHDEYFIVGVTVTTIFETGWALRGLERLMMDFVENPDLAHRILDIPLDYHLTAAKRLTRLGVDMIWIGDDVGSQNGMMISPLCWRTFLKPRMARFIAEVKAINPALKVAYHSDGDIQTIIPELIEVGVDVLNPIQPACMDPAVLKRQYGDRLCFWGSLDEQHTLPFGTPEDVRREVALRLKTAGQHGGLILGPTHHVQLDTPLENFWAMVDTITGTQCATL